MARTNILVVDDEESILELLEMGLEREGYGEVQTPALEYQATLPGNVAPAVGDRYRFYDETGVSLALRSDMTVPIARLVANRFSDSHSGRRQFF